LPDNNLTLMTFQLLLKIINSHDLKVDVNKVVAAWSEYLACLGVNSR